MKPKLSYKQLLRHIPNEDVQWKLAISNCKIIKTDLNKLTIQLNKMKYELTCLN